MFRFFRISTLLAALSAIFVGIAYQNKQTGMISPSGSPLMQGGNSSQFHSRRLGKYFVWLHLGGLMIFLALSQLVRSAIVPGSDSFLPEGRLIFLAICGVIVAFKGVKLLAANCEEVKSRDNQLPLTLHASFILLTNSYQFKRLEIRPHIL